MQVFRWSWIRFVLLAVGVGILTPVGMGLHWLYWPSRPTTSAEEVETVEIQMYRYDRENQPDGHQDEMHIRSTDPEQIQTLLDVFKAATRASDHKCGNSGTVTIIKKDG